MSRRRFERELALCVSLRLVISEPADGVAEHTICLDSLSCDELAPALFDKMPRPALDVQGLLNFLAARRFGQTEYMVVVQLLDGLERQLLAGERRGPAWHGENGLIIEPTAQNWRRNVRRQRDAPRPGLLLRQELERLHMTRPDHPKVSMVKRSQFWLVKPLNDSEYSSVHEPHI